MTFAWCIKVMKVHRNWEHCFDKFATVPKQLKGCCQKNQSKPDEQNMN